MSRTRVGWLVAAAVLVGLAAAGAVASTLIEDGGNTGDRPIVEKSRHVPEVEALLSGLKVDLPRTHKNMVVFPIRWSGKQAPGRWLSLDSATSAGVLKVTEKDQATVPEVVMENTGEKAVFLMSGEIVKGGRQTRLVKFDTVIEAKQRVAVPVFCVEHSRWSGGKDFAGSSNAAPAAIRERIKRGAEQGEVWDRVQSTGRAVGAQSPTGSLDEMMDSKSVQDRMEKVHEDLGRFSPPDTIGIAVADARTGRVVGLELFGRRDLFDWLQEKLVEGYATDVVLAQQAEWKAGGGRRVSEDEVLGFITRALAGTSRYEDTPGSGRGIDLESGSMKGKGVALGASAIHLSIQDMRPEPAPARPIIDEPQPRPYRGRQQADP